MATSHHALDTNPPQNNERNSAALGLIGGAFVGILALTTPFVAMQLRSSLPYSATPRRKVERALKFVRSASRDKPHDRTVNHRDTTGRLRYVDLGSGDGTTTLSAATLGWTAVGIELNPTLFLLSSLRRLCSPRATRRNSRFVRGDMFTNGIVRRRLGRADCVMVFGVAPLMPRIADLVQGECRPGCFLMSYRFRVPLQTDRGCAGRWDGREAKQKLEGAGAANSEALLGRINATLVYDHEEMRIYELNG